jgi:23S rRNA (cytidine1920-2'-O)/16S rRNA (cytidine1409-2'-O)-methyltransferase
VCLKLGAKLVYAVDVGKGQLDESLSHNPRLINYPQTHFNKINLSLFKYKIDIMVGDVSFISLTKLITHLKQIFHYPYKAIMLIKPQFELTPQILAKCKGKIHNIKLRNLAITKVKTCLIDEHFVIHGVIPAAILGNKKKNQEYLVYFEQQ